MPVWPSTPGYKEQHCGGYTAGQSSCTGQWLTSPAIANTLTKATVKPCPHEWINKPPSCIFQPEAPAKAPSQRAHLSQQYNYKCYSVYRWCAYSWGWNARIWQHGVSIWTFSPCDNWLLLRKKRGLPVFSAECLPMMSYKNANQAHFTQIHSLLQHNGGYLDHLTLASITGGIGGEGTQQRSKLNDGGCGYTAGTSQRQHQISKSKL